MYKDFNILQLILYFLKYIALGNLSLIITASNCMANETDIVSNANIEHIIGASNNLYLSTSINNQSISYNIFFQANNITTKNIWRGMITALFIDDKGRLREDSNANFKLDSTDAVVNFIYDQETSDLLITKTTANISGSAQKIKPISALKPLWSTDELAADIGLAIKSRDYNSISNVDRYLFTHIPQNNSTLLTNNLCQVNTAYFQLEATECDELINYLYGNVTSQQRSKTFTTIQGNKKITNIGDMIHSEAIVVGSPQDNYDYIYNDFTYAKFKYTYANRRKVIYVGANDGFIHAFNGGFYNSNNNEVMLKIKYEIEHALGVELWAYAPFNVLPRLKQLANPNYRQQFFINGSIQATDVRIFTPDQDHPYGWGTILIVGMGLGGSKLTLNVDGVNKTCISSFIILDITNPEKPPKFIAEINHKQLGFTLSKPKVIKRKLQIQAQEDKKILKETKHNWYLVLASGPATQHTDTNSANLKVFIYDLQKQHFVTGFNPQVTNVTQSYAGNMQSIDWHQDYEDGYIYFGTIPQNNNLTSGKLMQIELKTPIENSKVNIKATNLSPIVQSPLLLRDNKNFWIFFGSGRLLTTSDHKSKIPQFCYAICEPITDYNSDKIIDAHNLADVTNVEVLTTGEIKKVVDKRIETLKLDNKSIVNLAQLENAIINKNGWKFNFTYKNTQAGILQAPPKRSNVLILFSEFKPSNTNPFIGNRYLHLLNYTTGTASELYTVAHQPFNDIANKKDFLLKTINAGMGYNIDSYITTFATDESINIALQNGDLISIVINETVVSNKYKHLGRISWRRIK